MSTVSDFVARPHGRGDDTATLQDQESHDSDDDPDDHHATSDRSPFIARHVPQYEMKDDDEDDDDDDDTRTPSSVIERTRRRLARMFMRRPAARRNSSSMSSSPTRGKLTFIQTIKAIAFSSWLNVLLITVPLGIIAGVFELPPIAVFILNAIAIVPLSNLLAYATQCIASDLGDTIGAFMNISFGNLIEVIMFIIALQQGHILVVQGALVGSILINLLLVLGSAIIVGGFTASEQFYDIKQAQALACLLSLSVFSILIPIAFHYSINDKTKARHAVSVMSRVSAVALLIVYFVYLVFLLKPRKRPQQFVEEGSIGSTRMQDLSHQRAQSEEPESRAHSRGRAIKFADENQQPRPKLERSRSSIELASLDGNRRPVAGDASQRLMPRANSRGRSPCGSIYSDQNQSRENLSIYSRQQQQQQRTTPRSQRGGRSLSRIPRQHYVDIAERYDRAAMSARVNVQESVAATVSATAEAEFGEGENEPVIRRSASIVLLIVSTLLVAICSDFVVDTISTVTSTSGISESFIGLILLPAVGNAAEYITAVNVAADGKTDLALGVSFGSSIQIALFVSPLMVIVGWIMDKDMTLYFGLFDTVSLVGSALLVNVLIASGKTNYLEGSLLCACYVMVAAGAFLSP